MVAKALMERAGRSFEGGYPELQRSAARCLAGNVLGTTIFEGRAAPQGLGLPGGQMQKYMDDVGFADRISGVDRAITKRANWVEGR
jgi:hypothetical protein